MITPDLTHIDTLEKWYDELSKMQEKVHGEGYLDHHRYMREFGLHDMVYKELGVMQGTTAAAALLANAYELKLVDIDFSRFEPYKHLFGKYCLEYGIPWSMQEISSIHPESVSEADFLLMDTRHVPHHLKMELELHAPVTNRYIMVHDSYVKSSLGQVIRKYCEDNPWRIIEENKRSVGFTVMERIE